jgi:DNA (cytosine-5)-methyltransferase 1
VRFLSVCSGIEAASAAWRPLGWKAVAFSEIEPFPCAVLAHHYPDTPNWGDMTKFKDWPDEPIDLLCGGTPCQSFSVAGLRKGLDDPRGNLMLTYGAIAAKYRPRWLVWENVPGVLSSNGGWDFGSFLGLLGQLGYGFAYRVLDAQYFGLAQRRRRVFVVGCLGDWRSAAAVLFERHSLQGHPAPSRQAGQRPTGTIASRTTGGGGLGTDFECSGGLIDVAPTLDQRAGRSGENSFATSGGLIPVPELLCVATGQAGADMGADMAPTLNCNHEAPYVVGAVQPFSIMPMNSGKDYKARATDIAQPIMAGGPVGGNQGGDFIVTHSPVAAYGICDDETVMADCLPTMPTPSASGGGHPPAVAFQSSQSGVRLDNVHATLDSNNGSRRHNGVLPVGFAQNQRDEVRTMDVAGALAAEPGAKQQTYVAFSSKDHGADAGEISPTLRSMSHDGSHANGGGQVAVAFNWQNGGGHGDAHDGLGVSVEHSPPLSRSQTPAVTAMQVRRLTPRECERLQGFPDDYTLIPHRGKPAADGPRYKALGNSWAVPCARWIGERIEAVEQIAHERKAA